MRKLALVLEYEGTQFHGFQKQPQARTVQGALERVLFQITGAAVSTTGASRTDAGVHAQEQVVSLATSSVLSCRTLVLALNFYLPADLVVRGVWDVDEAFDARRSAASREYGYTILNRAVRSPLEGRFAYLVRDNLDVDAMDRAVQALVGEHDFASFTSPQAAREARTTVRLVLRAAVRREGDRVLVELEGSGFLPQQVRRTMGALLRVGKGQLTGGGFQEMVEAPRPGAAGLGVPPHGLCLTAVRYSPKIACRTDRGRVAAHDTVLAIVGQRTQAVSS